MSRFWSVELSDPALSPDNLRNITVKSPALKGRGDITVFVPPGLDASAKLPLVLLLHGVYGSHWAWTGLGGVHKCALDLIQKRRIRPMIIGMPSDGLWGDGTGYVAHHGIDFENWILEDVVDVIRECFPQAAATSPLFIGGLSMGGFGALWLAAKHPERFAGVSAHSSVTDLTQLEGIVSEGSSLTKAGGTDQWSVFAWMLKHKKRLPAIRFDCGLDDHLLGQNRELRQKLEQQGIPHRYEEFPGGHEWAYWREHIKDSLLFFEAQLD